jgi:subtilisin family serine protease
MGNIHTGNGTSYSTPLLAGLIACLWQAFPDKGNMEIIDMVKRSACRFHEPDAKYGYGIPDFAKLVE